MKHLYNKTKNKDLTDAANKLLQKKAPEFVRKEKLARLKQASLGNSKDLTKLNRKHANRMLKKTDY